MKKRKYIKDENKYIEWLENNMNRYELFYFKEDEKNDNLINCFFKIDDSKFSVFYKNIIDLILGEENNPNGSTDSN